MALNIAVSLYRAVTSFGNKLDCLGVHIGPFGPAAWINANNFQNWKNGKIHCWRIFVSQCFVRIFFFLFPSAPHPFRSFAYILWLPDLYFSGIFLYENVCLWVYMCLLNVFFGPFSSVCFVLACSAFLKSYFIVIILEACLYPIEREKQRAWVLLIGELGRFWGVLWERKMFPIFCIKIYFQ